MGNTLCGSVVVIAIPNAHTQDDVGGIIFRDHGKRTEFTESAL